MPDLRRRLADRTFTIPLGLYQTGPTPGKMPLLWHSNFPPLVSITNGLDVALIAFNSSLLQKTWWVDPVSLKMTKVIVFVLVDTKHTPFAPPIITSMLPYSSSSASSYISFSSNSSPSAHWPKLVPSCSLSPPFFFSSPLGFVLLSEPSDSSSAFSGQLFALWPNLLQWKHLTGMVFPSFPGTRLALC